MWEQWIRDNILTILTLVGLPLLTLYLNRNKQSHENNKTRAETGQILVDSSGKLASSWEKLSERLEKEYNECRNTNQKLIERVTLLEIYNNNLNKLVVFLIDELSKVNPELVKKARELLNDIEVNNYPKVSPFIEE